jgi:hypothetical protein
VRVIEPDTRSPMAALAKDPSGVRLGLRLPEGRVVDDVDSTPTLWLTDAPPGDTVALVVDAIRSRPLDESLYAGLIRLYCATGRRADALVAYDGIRRRLRKELGVERAPTLWGLYEAMLRDDPSLCPA